MKKILIGISGSIAAYKTVLLIRELSKNNFDVRVVITNGGQKFVTCELIAGLGIKVYTDENINFKNPDDAMLHINLAKWADLIMIAPASANTIAKLAHGIADNLLNKIILVSTNKDIFIAPAMNKEMYNNIATQNNLQKLSEYGFHICTTNDGVQACGDIGFGRMLEPIELQNIIEMHVSQKSNILHNIKDKTVVITLGATIEKIDPVRFISNNSSGKMGLALIKAALAHGAKVIAIYGSINVELPNNSDYFTKIRALTALEMLETSLSQAKYADIFIGCAAVCDYRIQNIAKNKIKKQQNDSLTLSLIANPDIIAEVKTQNPRLHCVGFAAETKNLIKYAKDKLKRKNLDVIIANDVGDNGAFGQDNNEIFIIDHKNINHYPSDTKANISNQIFIFLDKKLDEYI